ncbi:hypothetical protein PV10_00874 [Exophiala mesophila]|uniref:Deubiquitination-protection protein dph1 n=1 Tax=Exophiala mesophila TaxID=212818 RepID=A0A0D1ZT60_EXOME|nr:uncharacterized protein PV10_00874 [Exophiala mesophila]KIV97079.1 hypothetical protein PV10_00874 [Exophiala mesophila]
MADASNSEDATVTFHVKSSGAQKWTLTLPVSTTTQDLKAKLATEEYANVPASAQRLIYSGKVLKDNDTLATHNVKEGNTMHLVKSAASNQRQNPANQSSSNPASSTPSQSTGVPQNLAAGTGNDPLAGLTGARYAGFAQLPSASMFQTPQTPEDMIRQLEDPNFQQMMREAMNNPQFIDMMINQNPALRSLGPQAREMLQSDGFRQLMTNPQQLRSMMQMQQQLGMGPFAGTGGQDAFPAPGETNTTENRGATNTNTTANQQQQPNPFAAFAPFGAGGGSLGPNPFASLFGPAFGPPPQNPASPGTQPTTESSNPTADGNQQPPNPFAALFNPAAFGQAQGNNQPGANMGNPWLQNNPFLQNPEAANQLLQALGGGPGGAGGAGPGNYPNLFNMFGGGMDQRSQSPPDNRPPEERYEVQLRQLNDMGFYDFDRNVQALRRTGGSVNGAIEFLLSNP